MLSVINAERGKDDEAGDEPAFGLHFPLAYVLDTWTAYRNHGRFPEPGGFNDQDPALVQHDWGVLNARYSWLSRQNQDEELPNFDRTGEKDWMDI